MKGRASKRRGGRGEGCALETVGLLYERLVLVHEQLGFLHVSVGEHLLLRQLGDGFLGGVERLPELCNRFGVGFLGRRGLQGGEGKR